MLINNTAFLELRNYRLAERRRDSSGALILERMLEEVRVGGEVKSDGWAERSGFKNYCKSGRI
jgi:hypothetical protein